MAIEFTGATAQYLGFDTVPTATNLAQKSICFWATFDADNIGGNGRSVVSKFTEIPSANGWYVSTFPTKILLFARKLSSEANATYWTSPDNTYVYGEWNHYAITYDSSTITNNALIYKNGGSITFSYPFGAPSGTVTSDASLNLVIGNTNEYLYTHDGREQDIRIYNRILTPAEVYALYANRRIGYMRNGLVFHAPAIGAAGCTKFDGTTLGATNYVYDIINNAAGTPVGNPVGAGNTIQRIN